MWNKSNTLPVAGLTLFVTLGGLFPLLVCATTPGDLNGGIVPGWILSVFCALRLSMIAASGRPRWLLTLFHIFVYVAFGIFPMASAINQRQVSEALLASSDLPVTHAIIWIGVLFFELGYRFAPRRVRPPSGQEAAPPRTAPINALLAVAVLVTVAAVAIAGPDVFLSGYRDQGPSELTVFEDTPRTFLVVGTPRAIVAVALLYGIAAMSSFRRWRLQPAAADHGWSRKVARHVSLPLFLAVVLCAFVLFNPLKTARYVMGIPIIGAVLLLYRPRRYRMFACILVGVLCLGVLLPSTDPRRVLRVDRGSRLQNWAEKVSHPGELITSVDFDAFNMIGQTAKCVELKGIVWGDNLVMSVFYFVPRSLWKGKFVGTPIYVLQAVAPRSYMNASAPLWAEGYLAFGWVGLCGIMALYGGVCRMADQAFTSQADDWAAQGSRIVASLIGSLAIITLRGSLLTGLGYLFPCLAVCFYMNWLLTRPTRYARW